MGDTVCTRGLMKLFSDKLDGYDGVSVQQEAFDFLDKVFARLEREDRDSDDVNKQEQTPVKDLFKGPSFTQVSSPWKLPLPSAKDVCNTLCFAGARIGSNPRRFLEVLD